MVKMENNNQSICKIDEYGNKCWTLNNKYHREDGPAQEYCNGDKVWYYHGKFFTSQEEFERLINLKALW